MEKLLVLNTLEQIKAISNPYRMDILKSFARNLKQPWSVKMIADELGETPSKLHYHIKELEKNGILEIVDTREINGIIEKYYLPTAEQIVIEKDVLCGEEWKAEALQMICDMLDEAKARLTFHRGLHETAGIQSGIVYLDPDRLEEFDTKYNELIQQFSDPEKPGVKPYDTLFLYYPHIIKK